MDEDGLDTFLIDSIINFISGIFFESAILLALDEVLDYEGFVSQYLFIIQKAYTYDRLDYIGIAYFVVVSFSTIGYGEIYPIKTTSRLIVAALLVINITIMSNFLSQLIERIYSQKAFISDYEFDGHIVIFGEIPDSYLFKFISELIAYDNT